MKTKSPKIFHDSHFVSIKSWLTLLHLEKEMLPEIRKNETAVFLHHFPKKPIEYQVPIKSPLALKNNSSFAIANLSFFSRNAQKEVFCFKDLPPHKVIQLEFVKEGFYTLFYSFPFNQKVEERLINIVPQLPQSSRIPPHFDPQLKPSWSRYK